VDIDATHVTGFAVLDGLLTREFDASWDALVHLVLPAVALATIPLAVIVRITRASVLDVMGSDFVRTANSKGLAPRTVRERHVLRNALLPVSTTIGLQTGLLLAGAVLTEKVFVWGGLGTLLAQAIERRDYPRLQAVVLLGALVYVIVNLLVDLSYAIIDPRVRVR
jgi:peptide/nickel transport system permease protein